MRAGTAIRRAAAAGIGVAFVAWVASCGTDDNFTGTKIDATDVECQSGSIAGAGSTFAATIVQQWIKEYSSVCPGATVNYQAVGSGAGIQQFTAGTVDFAGSDSSLKPAEVTAAQQARGETIQIPWAAGAIAIEYRLTGVEDLRLSSDALAKIFAGVITRWDDAQIVAENPGVELPSVAIQVIHRSDGSGTTEAFTSYLSETAPDVWTVGAAKDVKWPVGRGAKGSDGVTAAVKAADGAISYAELSFAESNGLSVVKIQNPAGEFVGPTAAGVTAALAEATIDNTNKVKLDFSPEAANAYPISTVTYVIVPLNAPDAGKAALTKNFVDYAIGGGQDSAERLLYAPLSSAILTPAEQSVARLGS